MSTKSLCTNVHNSFIRNSPQMETTQTSSYRWMDKQFVEYSYNISSNLQRRNYICNNIDECQKHSEQKKPDTKGCVCMIV